MQERTYQALQSFVIGFKNSDLSEVKKIIKEFRIGGLIFFAENIPSLKEVTDIIDQFQTDSDFPLFISLDQEGGPVRRIKNGITEMPSMEELCDNYSKEEVFKLSCDLGKDLLKLGFNMNLAPVLDVDFYKGEDSVIGKRSFGNDPQTVADFAWEYARGMLNAGVIPVGKHFPGHGLTKKDSHKELPEIQPDIIKLGQSILPFKVAIEKGIPALMVAHLLVKDLSNDDLPVTLSPRAIDHLKNGFKFSGIIMTDDLPMKGITSKIPVEDASILAFNAGCDMLLISGFLDDQYKAIEKIIKNVENKNISGERIEDAFYRIKKVKEKLK